MTSWTYDPNRFWIASQTTDGNQQSLTYLHDPVGNITSISDGLFTASRTLTYDDLNRLATASGTFGTNQSQQNCTYGYNAIGNFLDKCGAVLSYNDPMHPSAVTNNSATGKNYTYNDANGNMTARGTQTLTWDIENRVTSVAISGGGTTYMEYDYSGMRVKKNAPTGITLFPFKGIEIDPNGTFIKFIRIGNETFASRKRTSGGTTTQFFYHNDHLGSINVITDITGARCQLNEYEPWGGVSRSEGPTPGSQPTCDTTHRFTGEELDPETGFYYYGGRYFDQEIGRFVSADPYVQEPDMPQNLNRYSYVLNNPVNLTDPNGHFFFELFSLVIAVLTATLPADATLGASLAQLAGTVMVQAVGANLDHAREASRKAELQKQREARGDHNRNNVQKNVPENAGQPPLGSNLYLCAWLHKVTVYGLKTPREIWRRVLTSLHGTTATRRSLLIEYKLRSDLSVILIIMKAMKSQLPWLGLHGWGQVFTLDN